MLFILQRFFHRLESVGFQKLTTEQAETVLSNTTFTINNADTGFFIILYRRLLVTRECILLLFSKCIAGFSYSFCCHGVSGLKQGSCRCDRTHQYPSCSAVNIYQTFSANCRSYKCFCRFSTVNSRFDDQHTARFPSIFSSSFSNMTSINSSLGTIHAEKYKDRILKIWEI